MKVTDFCVATLKFLYWLFYQWGIPTWSCGDSQIHDAYHHEDEIHNSLLITYNHKPGENDTACHTRPQGVCTYEHNEEAGAMRGRLCSMEWVGRPGPTGKCDCFVRTIPGNSRGMKPLTDSGVSESSKMKKGEFRVKEIQTWICVTRPVPPSWALAGSQHLRWMQYLLRKDLWSQGPISRGLQLGFLLAQVQEVEDRKWLMGFSWTLTYIYRE